MTHFLPQLLPYFELFGAIYLLWLPSRINTFRWTATIFWKTLPILLGVGMLFDVLYRLGFVVKI